MKKASARTRPQDRARILSHYRNLKMARSPQAYVRGTTAKFYEWLEAATNIPDGPPVWICGDCHMGNLGPLANDKGRIDLQIRDLDQTVIGDPAHDLIRLGLSLASAARGSNLPGVTTARLLEALIEGYEQAFVRKTRRTEVDTEIPSTVRRAMKLACRRTWKHLAKERLTNTLPNIPLGRRFWRLSNQESIDIAELFNTEAARRLATQLRTREDNSSIEVLDAAYWMKGCSSLGRVRYAVLLGIGTANRELCLMDIKEAVAPAAPRYARAKMPRDHAQRVVEGARQLAPFLGARMLAASLAGRSVFVRELMPQDLTIDIERLTAEEAMRTARFLAAVVGHAHARQMDQATRAQWHAELNRRRSKSLDAPSWLWSSVVDLLVIHEAAYLDHCRRYAMHEADLS
jgi:uncharacterized protein (DUF2252 family)